MASAADSWSCEEAHEAEKVVRLGTKCQCEERSPSTGRNCGRQRASQSELLLQLHVSQMYLSSRAWPGSAKNRRDSWLSPAACVVLGRCVRRWRRLVSERYRGKSN